MLAYRRGDTLAKPLQVACGTGSCAANHPSLVLAAEAPGSSLCDSFPK